MKYVITRKGLPHLLFSPVESGSYRMTIDPAHAQTFSSVKVAKSALADIYGQDDSSYFEILPLTQALSNYKAWVDAGSFTSEARKARNLKGDVYRSLDMSGDIPKQILQWWLIHYAPAGDANLKQSVYSSWNNYTYKYLQGISFSGYNAENDQACMQLRFDHKLDASSRKIQIVQILFALTLIKDITISYEDGNGKSVTLSGKYLSIMTDDCSEHGICFLFVTASAVFALKTVYHRTRFQDQYPDLATAVSSLWDIWGYSVSSE